jgi:hypothetical protein
MKETSADLPDSLEGVMPEQPKVTILRDGQAFPSDGSGKTALSDLGLLLEIVSHLFVPLFPAQKTSSSIGSRMRVQSFRQDRCPLEDDCYWSIPAVWIKKTDPVSSNGIRTEDRLPRLPAVVVAVRPLVVIVGNLLDDQEVKVPSLALKANSVMHLSTSFRLPVYGRNFCCKHPDPA